jgi:hypothetical protein
LSADVALVELEAFCFLSRIECGTFIVAGRRRRNIIWTSTLPLPEATDDFAIIEHLLRLPGCVI